MVPLSGTDTHLGVCWKDQYFRGKESNDLPPQSGFVTFLM